MTLAKTCHSSMLCFSHSQVTPAFVKNFEMWNACYRTPFQAYSCSCFPCNRGESGDYHKGPRHLQEIHLSKIPTSHTYFCFFSYFENNSFFCSQLVNVVTLGIVLRDRDQTMEIRMKKMIEFFFEFPPVSEMRISGQEIRHIKMEFCHHATEAVLEVRRVHWHFTPSLGFSELWKMSYWEGETKQKNSLMPFGKMESSFQNSLSRCHIHVEQSGRGWAASWKEDWATITNHITMGQQWEVNLCSERVKGCLKRGCLKACVLMLMFPNYPGELIYLTAKVMNLLSLSLCRCYRC